jgi:hypothetical protein
MTDPKPGRTEAKLTRLLEGLLMFAAGALAVLVYLQWSGQAPVPLVEELHRLIGTAFFALGLARTVLAWRQRKHEPALREITPGQSGAFVILATGSAAALSLGWGWARSADLILPGIVLAATIAIACLIFRFGNRHAIEIGDVRPPAAPQPDPAGEASASRAPDRGL